MNLQIREAREADAPAIALIYSYYVNETSFNFETDAPDSAEIAARIRKSLAFATWLVAEAGGVIAGYAYGTSFRDRAAYNWTVETSIYLQKDHLHCGLGGRLYSALFERLGALGFQEAIAVIALPNDASVAFHEKSGFRRVGIFKNSGYKKGAWRDTGWWQKTLGNHPNPPPKR